MIVIKVVVELSGGLVLAAVIGFFSRVIARGRL